MIREPGKVSALRRLLAPLSSVYGLAIRVRNARYDRNPRASHQADVPVISIGNITTGGTGKTPIVMETVRHLQELDRQPAVLTRGYGVGDAETPDEVLEFTEALPDVPLVVNPDRVAGAETARLKFGADCVVLDDGFQHRRLRRDLDIVVIDALNPWGGGRLLPAGNLREPLSSLIRADLFIISRSNQVTPSTLEDLEAALADHAPDITALRAPVVPEEVAYLDGHREDAEALGYHCVLPVCGLGNPHTFLRLVEQLAGRVCKPLVFSDHQRYSYTSVTRIAAAARRRGADLVVTTRKDWVKLTALWPDETAPDAGPDLARLNVRTALPKKAFDEHLRRAVEKRG